MNLYHSESLHSFFVVSVAQADNAIHRIHLFSLDSPAAPFRQRLHVSAG